MSEKLRFISPEPKLAKVLRSRKPIVMAEETYDWFVSWVEDVGTVMRSREYMVSTVAYYISYGLLLFITSLPLIRGLINRFPIFKRTLGV